MDAHRVAAPIAVVALLFLSTAPMQGGPTETVGRLVQIDLQSSHPYAADSPMPGEWTVHSPGATYVRLHVSRLHLAPGDRLEIASPDGSQSFLYEGEGPYGDGEFWANTIQADTAIVRLRASQGGAYGFSIDQYGSGTKLLPGPASSSPCGVTDWQDAVCYDNGPYEAAWVRSKSVAQLLVGCCTQCTGFRVSDSGQYLTAHECVPDQRTVRKVELTHREGVLTCGGPLLPRDFFVLGRKLLDTDALLGFTLFTSESYLGNRCLPLAAQPPAAGDTIYIPHYPLDGARKLSIASDQSTDGLCHVAQASGPGVTYDCDTDAGSAGAPVVSSDDHVVAALHLASGCPDTGTSMDAILARIGPLLDSCTPVPATCGNGVIDAGEDCDGADLGGNDCLSVGIPSGGVLACNDDCTFLTVGCFWDCVISPKPAPCNCDGKCSPSEEASPGCADCWPPPQQ